MIKLIDIPIYNRNLIIGTDCTCDEYVEWVKGTLEESPSTVKLEKVIRERFSDKRSYKASCVNIQGEGLIVHFRDKSPGVISHEAFHIVHAILDDAGIKLSFKSDEAFAYLIEYLVTEISLCC